MQVSRSSLLSFSLKKEAVVSGSFVVRTDVVVCSSKHEQLYKGGANSQKQVLFSRNRKLSALFISCRDNHYKRRWAKCLLGHLFWRQFVTHSVLFLLDGECLSSIQYRIKFFEISITDFEIVHCIWNTKKSEITYFKYKTTLIKYGKFMQTWPQKLR